MAQDQIQFRQLIKVGCSIDVHQNLIVATIRRSNDKFETRSYDGYTSSLTALRDWCKSEGVTHVAMESTGIYWKPVLNILEENFEIILVNARHVKNVPGHKTDKKDSIWLSKLLLSGLLKGSFIPPQDIRELRDLVRYKKKIVAQAASEKNRIIKTLEDANIKLSSVLSNVDGAVGTKIINDLIAGKTDPLHLLQYYHGKMKASKEELKKSVEGRLTKHHQFMLSLMKQSIKDKENLITLLEVQIDEAAKQYSIDLEHLQTIPGINKDSAISIISETGVNMEQFANEHHLSSWAGMSPGSNESGGKKKAPEPSEGTSTSNPPW